MPIYEFHCEDCDEVFEVRASIREREDGLELKCPKCESENTRQLISRVMLLHGSDGASLTIPGCGPDRGPGCC
jgi:putative FmdB family regulatory protein